MALTTGTRLGSYEIVSPLGAGGMGEVYRACDERLGRDVAIKVLPAHVSDDLELRQRFEREARTLATLSHPHICAVFDVGRQEPSTSSGQAIDYIVLELLEGETLADRIAKGPLPLDQALRYGVEIADALDKAHRKGVIHRDLKPANIMLTKGGAKLLDFGLAKHAAPAAGVVGASMLPTTPRGLTVQGTILGTFQYMAPEQLEGTEADARTDIFAFGAVLYEMLTGRKAFDGKSQASLISAIMSSEPPAVSSVQPVVPPALDQIVRTCLAKDPDERWQTAADIERQLKFLRDGRTHASSGVGMPPATAPRRFPMPALVAGIVGLVVGGVLAGAVLWSLTRPDPVATQRVSIVVPADHPLALGWTPGLSLAISPDGSRIAYAAQNPLVPPGDARRQLYVRSLDDLEARALAGTEGAAQPFFSPDGQWVGFFTSTALKKVSLTGGSPLTLIEDLNGGLWTFGTWQEDGTIVFGGQSTNGLYRVPSDGGVQTQITTLDATQGENSHIEPIAAGTAVIFSVGSTGRDPKIEALLDTGERRVVVENARGPVYLTSGHLMFLRDDVVLVAAFDAARLALTGPAVPILDDIRRDRSTRSGAEVVVSASGAMAYVRDTGATTRALGIVSRAGAFSAFGLPPAGLRLPRVSQDGRYVAYEVVLPGDETEVHIYDVSRGSTTRLTQQGPDFAPAWRPNSRQLAVWSPRADPRGIYLRDPGGGEQLLATARTVNTIMRNMSWSPDGRVLAYTAQDGPQHDIWMLTMGDKPVATPWLNTVASEWGPKFSPDGRWVVYVLDDSGKREVYVRPYPSGDAQAVSVGGGQNPVWAPDGGEIFFTHTVDGAPYLMVVAVEPDGKALRLTEPRPLLPMRVPGAGGTFEEYGGGSNVGAEYDVFPDGRFVMVKGPDPQGTREIVLVQNFFEEVKRLAPAP